MSKQGQVLPCSELGSTMRGGQGDHHWCRAAAGFQSQASVLALPSPAPSPALSRLLNHQALGHSAQPAWLDACLRVEVLARMMRGGGWVGLYAMLLH